MTGAQRGDFDAPAPVPASARDTWRDQMEAALFRGGADNYDVALDLVMRVLVAAQREAAAIEMRKLACEALEATPGMSPVWLPVAALFDRASALRAGGDRG